MNPATFMKSAEEMASRMKEAGALGYQSRVARKIAIRYKLDISIIDDIQKICRSESRAADFLPAIKGDEACRFPPAVFIEKINEVQLGELLLTLKKSQPWHKFLEVLKVTECGLAALVFPVRGQGSWVIHNLPTFRQKGVPRLVIPSGEGGVPDAEVLPLDDFLKEYQYGD